MAATLIKTQGIGTYSDYYLKLYFEETVNATANTSSVTVSLYGYTERALDYCAYNNEGGSSISITIDGTTNTLSDQSIDTRDWRASGGYLLHSYTKTVNHNSDGTKTITVSGSIKYPGAEGSSSLLAGTYSTGDVSRTLTAIPRASALSSFSGNTVTGEDGNLTFYLSKGSSTFYDRIVTSGLFIWTIDVGTGTSGSITWQNVIGSMPRAMKGKLNIEVQSYTDNTYTTLIGSSTSSVNVELDPMVFKPTISLSAITPRTADLSGNLVAGKSTAQASWSFSLSSGSQLASLKIEGVNCTIASAGTASSGTAFTARLPVSQSSNYTIKIKATVTDSRGMTATAETAAVTVYAYKPPVVTVRAYRTGTNSSTAEDPAGSYAYIVYTTAIGASVNGQNSITSTSTNPANLTSGTWRSLAANSTLTVRVTATDAVGESTTVRVEVPTARVPLQLYSNAAGDSVGVGIGATAEPGKIRSALPLYLNDTTAVGTILTASSTSTSLSRNTETNLCSLSLTKGKWVVVGQFRMQGAAAFQCSVGISTTSGTSQVATGYAQLPVTTNVGNISCSVARIIDVTSASQTIYLVGWHNHSSSRTMVSGQNNLAAICIA